jgi:TP901 family phage tail tape measure protein
VDADLLALRIKVTGGKSGAAEVKALNTEVAATGAAAKKASTEQAAAQARLARTATSLKSVGRGLTTYVSLPIAGVGIAAGMMALDFDRSMRNVNSIAQLPERQFESLKQKVLDLAGPTAQAPKTLAEGLYDLVSSGFDAAEGITILRHSALAASAGLTTTEVSTKAVAAVLNAYQLKASAAGGVSDTLFETVNRGVLTFEELASTIGDVLPFAAQMHVNLNEIGAATSTMTKAGLSAPETMTRLKNTLVTLLKPGKDLKNRLKEMNTTGEELVSKKGLQGALEAIIAPMHGNKEAIAAMFPNIRALGGVLALTGRNSARAAEDLASFRDTSGATARVLKQQEQSFGFQLQRSWAQLSAVLIELGEELLPVVVPAILSLAHGAQQLVGWFLHLPGPMQKVVVEATALAALAGPMLVFAAAVLKAAKTLGLLEAMSSTGILSGRGKGALSLLGKIGAVGLGVGASQMAGDAAGGDFGNWLSNVGSGAAVGAGVGSVVPVVGTGVGALVGGAAGGLLSVVQKLNGAEKDLTATQMKLARDSKFIAKGMENQRIAGGNLGRSTVRLHRANARQKAALDAVRAARARVTAAEAAYGPTAAQTISAERRLQLAIQGKTRALHRAQMAQRKHGIELQQFKQIAVSNVLAERNEVNILSRKKFALDREWVAAKRSGAGQNRLNELAEHGQHVSSRLAGANKRLAETISEAAVKAGPKFATFLRNANRETLKAGGTFKLLDEQTQHLTLHLEQLSEVPPPNLSLGRGRHHGVGHNAAGTEWWRGGLSLVGERGPELLDLPRGSRVFSAPRTRAALGEPRTAAAVGNLRGGNTRYLVATPIKVGKKVLLEAMVEAREDAEARL